MNADKRMEASRDALQLAAKALAANPGSELLAKLYEAVMTVHIQNVQGGTGETEKKAA